ncbi:MAG: arylsulfatase [Bacteroidia bacterium]|nr:arylsulfatase [Bacteroidia bacterium]
MNQRIAIHTLIGLIALLSAGRTKAQDRPNIIFILADDMSYRDLSAYGQQRYQTPNLDRLAADGLRFTQAYSAAPECAPSRSSLMTGLHTGHGPIRMNSSARGQDHLAEEDLTIAEVLQESGYRTGFAGKWGIGVPGTPGVPYLQGFDYTFGFYDQTRAHTYLPEFLWENDRKVSYPQNKGFDMARRYDYRDNQAQNTYDASGRLFVEELADPYGYAYSDNEVEAHALAFLEANNPAVTGDPFFLYYATQLPHGPVIVDELGQMMSPDSVNQLSREWAAMVIKLDQFVGKLIEELKAKGIYDNTVIFFASDNGYSMCGYTDRGNGPDWPDDPWLQNKGPFAGGKFSVLEGGCRVPMMIHWPGHLTPAVIDEPVWLPDFFPTAVALSGGNPADFQTDGHNLLPLLGGGDFQSHEYLYFSRGPEQAVRLGPWKAYRPSYSAPVQLYLLSEDSYTEKDLAFLYPRIVRRVEQIMIQEHLPHPWYRNPWETQEEFAQKKKKAIEMNQTMPVLRPNGIESFPWEK